MTRKHERFVRWELLKIDRTEPQNCRFENRCGPSLDKQGITGKDAVAQLERVESLVWPGV